MAGIPASGKSSVADLILEKTNTLLQKNPKHGDKAAVLVGLDGWHLTRAQLDAHPTPKLAHDKRGAHWTFDGSAYLDFVTALRRPVDMNSPVITAPSFDHALKDPTPEAVSILPHHRIVIIEGLYALLSIGPWRQAGELLDVKWYLEVGVDEAQRRLVKRHVVTGVAKDMEEAILRAEDNDMPSTYFFSHLKTLPF